MAAHDAPTALTVLLAPRGSTEDLLAVLGDYSAAGLLSAFAWIDAAEVGRGGSVPATLMTGGRAEPVALAQLLTGQRYARVRVAVLVPVSAPPGARVPLAAEQAVEQIVSSSSLGTPVTLLRLLLTGGPGGSAPPDPTLVLEGWHNLLIAPEDSPGPGLGSALLDRLTDALDLARHVAPVVAGVAGLWADVEATPFDTLAILPGQTVRAVRGFYRRLDTDDVEARLRTQLFAATGRLPLPHGGQVPVVYVDDAALAAQFMARALWTKHRDVLRGPRLALETSAAHAISIWAALKMFLRFLGAALRRAPSAWLSAALGSVSSALASTVQSTVFGRTDSAFAVVANPGPAGWAELGRSADAMSTALTGTGGDEQLAHQDLGPLWTDFVNGALTLADGGRRGDLEPVRVGAAVGVLPGCAEVVPGATERFSAIPASLAAVIGMGSVEGVDVLGVATLRERLQRAFPDPAAGVEARHCGAELDRWQARVSRSYGWQVAAILADFLGRARAEVTDLVGRIRSAAGEMSVDERLRRRQQTIGLILKTFGWAVFAVLVSLVSAAALGWLRWAFALSSGGVLLAVYVVVAVALFLVIQRDLFAAMNLRESQIGQLDAMQTNLRAALADLSRLSTAYGQLLAWCRAVGAVLPAPFGSLPTATAAPAPLLAGLPRSTQVAVAAPAPEQADTAVRRIQQRLYGLGWLTRPWDQVLAAAAAELRDDPATLLAMPGAGTGSALDGWSCALASGRVAAGGAEALWGRVRQMLADPGDGVGDRLTGTVVLADGTRVPAGRFDAGMTERRAGRAAPFDVSLFSHAAATAGCSAVAIDEPVLARRGLAYTAAVVQASDGLPAYDFALFAPPLPAVSGSPEERTTVLSVAERDTPPGGKDLVF